MQVLIHRAPRAKHHISARRMRVKPRAVSTIRRFFRMPFFPCREYLCAHKDQRSWKALERDIEVESAGSGRICRVPPHYPGIMIMRVYAYPACHCATGSEPSPSSGRARYFQARGIPNSRKLALFRGHPFPSFFFDTLPVFSTPSGTSARCNLGWLLEKTLANVFAAPLPSLLIYLHF